MENNHLRNVPESKPCRASTLSPFDILGNVNSGKRPSSFVICTPHDQIPRSAEAMTFDKPFKTISKNAFIRFDCGGRIHATTPDPNIATKNCSVWRGANGLKSSAEPVAMRATIGIDECDVITGRSPNSKIPRWAGSRL